MEWLGSAIHIPPEVIVKVIEIVIAFLLPPLAVAMKKGLGKKVLIALILQLLGHIPGVIYALYIITQEPSTTT